MQASLAQEQSERARLLTQMRELLSGNSGGSGGASRGGGGAGDAELERLRGEALRRHQEAAAATAGRERAEAQAASWKGEAKALRERIIAVERVWGRVVSRSFILFPSWKNKCVITAAPS